MVFFLILAMEALSVDLTPDDIMNIAYYDQKPFWFWLSRVLFPFDPSLIRPSGGVWYLSLYQLVGLNPVLYHVSCLGLLCLNIFLISFLANALTGSIFATFVSVLLASYHARLADLYYSAGTIFDIASGGCFLAAMLLFVRGSAGAWAVVALFILGLGFKETTVVLPAVMGACLVFLPPDADRSVQRKKWRLVITLSAIAVVFALSRFASPMLTNPAYRPTFTVHKFLMAFSHYAAHMTLRAVVSQKVTLGILAAFVIIAVPVPRSRVPICWIIAGLLPIAFVPERSLYTAYLSSIGVSLLIGGLIGDIEERSRLQKTAHTLSAAAIFAALSVAWFTTNLHHRSLDRTVILNGANQVGSFLRQVSENLPRPSTGAAILLVDDPFTVNEWTPV
ncbi:MAG TPA: hypothetical protein VE621_23150, partial [Bryobacteraceae bacterium]|nr:hypothetical protein [Bryobacteraceae bacterium]